MALEVAAEGVRNSPGSGATVPLHYFSFGDKLDDAKDTKEALESCSKSRSDVLHGTTMLKLKLLQEFRSVRQGNKAPMVRLTTGEKEWANVQSAEMKNMKAFIVGGSTLKRDNGGRSGIIFEGVNVFKNMVAPSLGNRNVDTAKGERGYELVAL